MPDEVLFVGDDIKSDYRGARAVGMQAILIEREDRSADDSHNLESVRYATKHSFFLGCAYNPLGYCVFSSMLLIISRNFLL
jgi:hypothetical protein